MKLPQIQQKRKELGEDHRVTVTARGWKFGEIKKAK